MRLTLRHSFAAEPARVHAMLVDTGFLEHACRELGAEEYRVASSPDETVVSAEIPTPEAVRGFLGPRMSARQEYTWEEAVADGSRAGTVLLTVEGAPVLVTGTTALRAAGGATEFTLDADLSVSVPLIGRTIERAAAPELEELLEAQARVGDAWLARR